jgi:lysozyme
MRVSAIKAINAQQVTIQLAMGINDDENPELLEISEAKAAELLAKDLQVAESAVLRNLNVPLNLNQYGAIVSFTFNVGAGAFQRSTLRQKLNRGEYKAIPFELLRWTKVNGRTLQGLINRRRAEIGLFVG